MSAQSDLTSLLRALLIEGDWDETVLSETLGYPAAETESGFDVQLNTRWYRVSVEPVEW